MTTDYARSDVYPPVVEAIDDSMSCGQEDHVPGCPGGAGGDHEYVVGLSMLRCSECGDLLDDGICENHGRLDDGREGQPEFNGAFG